MEHPGLRLRTGNLSGDISSTENIDLSRIDVNAGLSHADLDRITSLLEGTLAGLHGAPALEGKGRLDGCRNRRRGLGLAAHSEALHARIAESQGPPGCRYVLAWASWYA